MARTPDPHNYSLGRGVVYFDSDGNGLRDLGNCPEFTLSVEVERLAHYSSRSGLRAKDKEVVLELTPSFSFNLDEINGENLALTTLAKLTESMQGATSSTETVNFSAAERAVSLNLGRGLGVNKVRVIDDSGYQIGETLTGGTSGASAILLSRTVNILTLGPVTGGPFQDGESITGGLSAHASDAVGDSYVDTSDVGVTDSGTPTIGYIKNIDYRVSTVTGLITATEDGAITVPGSVEVWAEVPALTYTKLDAFAVTEIEGEMLFVSDNPSGDNYQLHCWRVSLSPDGDTSFIGDDWSILPFAGEILRDETNHPDSPYMEVEVIPTN